MNAGEIARRRLAAYGALPFTQWPVDALQAEFEHCRGDYPRTDPIEAAVHEKLHGLIVAKADLQKTIYGLPASDHAEMVLRGQCAVVWAMRRFRAEGDIPFQLYLFAKIEAAVLSVVIDLAQIPGSWGA